MYLLCVHDMLVKTDSFSSNAAFRIFTNLPDFYIFMLTIRSKENAFAMETTISGGTVC